MADHFSPDEWAAINAELDTDPAAYGLPERSEGSVLLGSFNIRKLGNPNNRTVDDWRFLAKVCARFDLIAVQEIMSDLGGLNMLIDHLDEYVDGDDGFAAVVSDETGAFAGDAGLRERLGFVYRWSTVERGRMASDLTYDRTKTFQSLVENAGGLKQALDDCDGDSRDFRPPFFVTFARQPYVAAFRIATTTGEPYDILAVDAHLIFGDRIDDRRREFTALMDLLKSRLVDDDNVDLILMGDLNLDFDKPGNDRQRIDKEIKELGASDEGSGAFINFPFLDKHQGQYEVFRTNARLSETYDHIGLFAHDQRLPAYDVNEQMPLSDHGPDYGVFNFMELFSRALYGRAWDDLDDGQRKGLWKKSEHSVSDHLPLWLRLPV